jgi:hypothetical protein
LTDCFASKTIPIYWGNPHIGQIFDAEAILPFQEIDRKMITPELYNKLLPHVENNYQRVQKLELPDDIIFKKIKTALLKNV